MTNTQVLIKTLIILFIIYAPIIFLVIRSYKKAEKENNKYWKEVDRVIEEWIKDIAKYLDEKTEIKIKNNRLYINNYKSSQKSKVVMTHFLNGIYVGINAYKSIGRKK